jgi:hypothetical protein
MSANISPAGWPANQAHDMPVEERKEYINQQITLWVGNLRLDAALTAEELGQYSGMQKALLLRNGLLVGAVRHCRLNPLADTRMSILALITFLADNNEGICYLSVSRMCEIFARSREAITKAIAALEKDGQIGINRKDGMPSCYWPLLPAALAELSANPVWFVDALSTKPKYRLFGSPEEAIEAATADRSSLPDQSRSPDQSRIPDQYRSTILDHHRSRIVDELVKDRRRTGQGSSDSISLTISLPISQTKDASATDPPPDETRSTGEPQFDEFWAVFPPGRKEKKGDARDLFRKIVAGRHKSRHATGAALVEGAKRYAASRLGQDPQYTKMPSTWLNGGCWEDELSDQPKPRSAIDAI